MLTTWAFPIPGASAEGGWLSSGGTQRRVTALPPLGPQLSREGWAGLELSLELRAQTCCLRAEPGLVAGIIRRKTLPSLCP